MGPGGRRGRRTDRRDRRHLVRDRQVDIDAATAARYRLAAQGLVGGAADPVEAVRRLVAVQAQDVVAPLVAVAARTDPRVSRVAVEAAFAAGRLVRSWTMRGTLHVVAAEDVSPLLALTGTRQDAAMRGVRQREGIDEDDFARAAHVVDTMPESGLLRPELVAAFAAAGLDTGGSRAYHLITWLAVRGLLHIGTRDGTRYRMHRSAGRLPVAPVLDPEEALAALAVRYVRSHGPATAADLAGWAGITVTASRRGLVAAGDALAPVDLDGEPAWIATDGPEPAPAGTVLALPAFDDLLLAYASRGPVLGDLPLSALIPAANGRFLPVIVLDGRVVATWDARTEPHVTPLVHLSGAVRARSEAAAAGWRDWLAIAG